MKSIEPETPVRLSVKQLLAFAVFVVLNTSAVVLYMDRRQTSSEHRLAVVEREQASLNTRLEKLTDAINTLAVNVARIGSRP